MPYASHRINRLSDKYSDPSCTFLIHLGIRKMKNPLIGDTEAKAIHYLANYSRAHIVAFVVLPNRVSIVITPTDTNLIEVMRDIRNSLATYLPAGTEFFDDFLDLQLKDEVAITDAIAYLSESKRHNDALSSFR